MTGFSIQELTATQHIGSDAVPAADKTAMVKAARQLLSAITKVLLLADKVVVKQLLVSKDKVRKKCSCFDVKSSLSILSKHSYLNIES